MNPVSIPTQLFPQLFLLLRRRLAQLMPLRLPAWLLPPRRWAWLLPVALLVLPGAAAAQPLAFGEGYVFAGCLHIVAESYLGRQGDVDNHDWVTMRVTNNCGAPLKHLQIALILLDAGGAPYGTAVWLLERGIYMSPGKSRVKKVAVPDPDNRIAVRWEAKVLQVSRAFGRGRRGKR